MIYFTNTNQDGPYLESSSYLNMTLIYLGPLDPGTMDPWYGLVWFGLLGFISDNFFKKSLSFYRANIKLLYSQYYCSKFD